MQRSDVFKAAGDGIEHNTGIQLPRYDEDTTWQPVDALPVAVYATDRAGRLLHFNEAAAALWGRTPHLGDEYWCGCWQMFRVDGTPLAHADCPMAIAIRENRAMRGVEVMAARPDGSLVALEAYPTPLHDGNGTLVGGMNVLIDVSARKAAEQALLTANAELEHRVEERTREREAAVTRLFEAQKMEAIGQLTGGIAHDFNNLLAAATINLDLLHKRVVDDPRLSRLVDGVLQSLERGASLTRRMLAFARRQELALEAVDVAALIRGMLDLMQSAVGASVQVLVDVSPELPPVLTDPHQLELALLNLAVNARDAMPNGGVLRIAAVAEQMADELDLPRCGYVRIAVSDCGLGMNEVTLRRATEPFFTTKDVGKGTGLGLSMVHGLAAQSGGGFRLRSAPGKGTTAELWLPQTSLAVAPDPRKSTGEPRPRAGMVLFVDDDALIAKGAAMALEDLGYGVVTAGSGAKALEILAKATKIDLLIADYAMPAMTGLELARIVRRRWPDLPIILATGYADMPISEMNLPRLDKPYHQSDLARRCAELLAM